MSSLKPSCQEFRNGIERHHTRKNRKGTGAQDHLATCALCFSWWQTRFGTLLDEAIAVQQGQPVTALAAQIKSLLLQEQEMFVYYAALPSPLGEILLACRQQQLCGVAISRPDRQLFEGELEERFQVPALFDEGRLKEALQELQEYFSGQRRSFGLPVDISWMTPFQRDVLQCTAEIPAGEVRTYGEVAKAIGSAGASRAVGNALGRNPVPIVIPCHRVLAAHGRIGGYSGGGPEIKRRLLHLEGVHLPPAR
jgi:methylated-DNA-[protein]-cysteine S-methyltransferase